MSRDSGFKVRKFLFFSQFYIKFYEKLPNLGKISSKTKMLQAKNKLGVENTTPLARSTVVIGLKLRLDSALHVFKALEVSQSARAGTEWSQLGQWTQRSMIETVQSRLLFTLHSGL